MVALSVKEIAQAVNGKILCGDGNETISMVGIASNKMEEGGLFVPIIGEQVDAHNYIDDAFAHGAKAVFTMRGEVTNHEKIFIAVDDTVQALQELGAYYRRLFNIPVVGITGSVGKTTTKEMIAAALETRWDVLKTSGNMNSQIGLPLTVFGIERHHKAAIIEMGMSQEGEMERLSYIAKPDMAVLTNIGVSHIENLKTKENIRKAKLNIINHFSNGGIVYFNDNDELLKELLPFQQNLTENNIRTIDVTDETSEKLAKSKLISYGTDESCIYRATDIETINGETHFTLNYPSGSQKIIIGVLGIHNVYNALVALAVADCIGVAPNKAKKGLYEYRPIAMRGQIYDYNGIKIIDDTYNASPDSMKSGIEVLLGLKNQGRKIAVLADVRELGEMSYACHYEVGTYITGKPLNALITVGKEAAAIAKAVQESGVTHIEVYSVSDNQEAISLLKNWLKQGDALLVKGSRGMHTEEILHGLTGKSES